MGPCGDRSHESSASSPAAPPVTGGAGSAACHAAAGTWPPPTSIAGQRRPSTCSAPSTRSSPPPSGSQSTSSARSPRRTAVTASAAAKTEAPAPPHPPTTATAAPRRRPAVSASAASASTRTSQVSPSGRETTCAAPIATACRQTCGGGSARTTTSTLSRRGRPAWPQRRAASASSTTTGASAQPRRAWSGSSTRSISQPAAAASRSTPSRRSGSDIITSPRPPGWRCAGFGAPGAARPRPVPALPMVGTAQPAPGSTGAARASPVRREALRPAAGPDVNRSGAYPWRRWRSPSTGGSAVVRGRAGARPDRGGPMAAWDGPPRRDAQASAARPGAGRAPSVRSRILGRVVGRRRVRCSTPCRPARRRSHRGLPVAIWLALDGATPFRLATSSAGTGKDHGSCGQAAAMGTTQLHETPLRRFLSVLCGSVETRGPPLARGRGTLGESAIAAPDAGRPPPGGIGEGRRRFSSGGSS